MCWWLKITQKECSLLGCVFVLCRPGTKTFLCVFVLFLAKNDGSCAKDVCFL